MRYGGWLHSLWWHYGNDTSLPLQLWRPYCWLTGQHWGQKRWQNNNYGACVYCRKDFGGPYG